MSESLIDAGFRNLLGGANAFIEPLHLPEDQYARGNNLTSRGGMITTRPRFQKVASLPGTVFQRAGMYTLNSTEHLVYCADGVVSMVDTTTWVVTPVAAFPTLDFERAYFCKADRYMVVQNGIDRPLFMDGPSDHRFAADYRAYDPDTEGTENEVYTGDIMAYGHGRLFVRAKHVHANDGQPITTTEGRPYFVAGDILFPNDPERVLRSTETTYLNGGGAVGMPQECGFVTGMCFLRNAATGTGAGALVAFGQYGASAFAVNAPRAKWQDIDFSQVLFTGVGTRAPDSVITANSDIFFRAADGWRSIQYTRSGITGALSNIPMSLELQPYVDMDQSADVPLVSAARVGNRVFFTTGGRDDTGAFRALGSMDTAVLARMGQSADVLYDGVWTGIPALQILSTTADRERLLVIAKVNGALELWQLSEDSRITTDPTGAPVCRLFTREHWFETQALPTRVMLKRFEYADIILRDIRSAGKVTLYYKPEGAPGWYPCETREWAAPAVSGSDIHRVRICPKAETQRIKQWAGHGIQFCLVWQGVAKVAQALFYARAYRPEPNLDLVPDFTYSDGTSILVEVDEFSGEL